MTCSEAEKNLCQFLAGICGLVSDQQIFAGCLPPEIPEGVAVSLCRGCPASDSSVSKYRIAVKGSFLSRRKCFSVLEAITSALPVYASQTGFLSIRLEPGDPVVLSQEEDPGKKENFSFELTLTVSFA